MKFGRHYNLTIETIPIRSDTLIGPSLPDANFIGASPDTRALQERAIEIKDPLTCEFSIERNANSSLNNATFKIYNLSKTNSNQLTQNRYSAANLNGTRKKVIFKAGYDELSVCFVGSILEAYPYRSGTELITFINAQDGGSESYTTFSNTTLSAGTTFIEGFKTLAKGMGLEIGTIGETVGEHKRGKALIGNNFSLLSKDFKDEFFIDLGKINKLKVNEYIKSKNGKPLAINSQTGLLGTPILQGTRLVVDMIFEPRVSIGIIVDIKSDINPKFDGQYKVIGISHNGIISEASSGEARTTLQLDTSNEKLIGR